MKQIMNDKNGLVFSICFILLSSLLVPKTVVEMTDIKNDSEILLEIKNIDGKRVLEYSINLRNRMILDF